MELDVFGTDERKGASESVGFAGDGMFFDPLISLKGARTAFRRKPFLLRDNLLDSLSVKIEDAGPGYPPFQMTR